MTAREGSGERRLSRWVAAPRRGLARLGQGMGFGAADRTAAPVAPLRPRPALAWLLPWLVAGGWALVLLPLNVTLTIGPDGVPPLVALVAGIAQSTALVLIMARPRAATALQFLAVTAFAVAVPPSSGLTWPLTVTGLITLSVHIGLIAARTSRRVSLETWWAGALLITVVAWLDPRGRSLTDGLPITIIYLVVSVVVLGAVLMTRQWREIRRQLAAARRDVEAEQSQRAVAEERTRIARELHDVVAHSMSVIHMQATSAPYRIKDLDPDARAEFAEIAAGARSTLREMRQLLAVLRHEGAGPELAPMPGLDRLDELVGSAGRAGVPVEVRAAEAVRAAPLPEGVTLAAYRIIQESLSNVIRHAPGAATTIGLERAGPDLVVSVVNQAATQPAQPMEAPGRAGHGLAGMHERARLAGGSLESGPGDEGGYRVVARLPIGDPS